MICYRIKDSRDKYFRWFRHSHHYRYGEFTTKEDATVVHSQKELIKMVMDLFKTVTQSKNPSYRPQRWYEDKTKTPKMDDLSMAIQLGGLAIETLEITETVTGTVDLSAEPKKGGGFRPDTKELRKSLKG